MIGIGICQRWSTLDLEPLLYYFSCAIPDTYAAGDVGAESYQNRETIECAHYWRNPQVDSIWRWEKEHVAARLSHSTESERDEGKIGASPQHFCRIGH